MQCTAVLDYFLSGFGLLGLWVGIWPQNYFFLPFLVFRFSLLFLLMGSEAEDVIKGENGVPKKEQKLQSEITCIRNCSLWICLDHGKFAL